MREAGTTNMGAYLRKMALDGYILRLDLPELKEMLSQLRYMGNNVNQIAKRANEVGVIDEMDIPPSQGFGIGAEGAARCSNRWRGFWKS